MNKLFTLLLSILCSIGSYSQFRQMGYLEKSDESLILMEDGSVKNGIIKNLLLFRTSVENSEKDKLRNVIRFAPSKDADFEDIFRKDVKEVHIKTQNGYFFNYDKVVVKSVDVDKLGKRENQDYIVFMLNHDLKGFKRYFEVQVVVYNYKETRFYYYAVQHPVTHEFYYFKANKLLKRKHLLKFMRFMGSDCPEFVAYVNSLDNKKAFKEVEEALKNLMMHQKIYQRLWI